MFGSGSCVFVVWRFEPHGRRGCRRNICTHNAEFRRRWAWKLAYFSTTTMLLTRVARQSFLAGRALKARCVAGWVTAHLVPAVPINRQPEVGSRCGAWSLDRACNRFRRLSSLFNASDIDAMDSHPVCFVFGAYGREVMDPRESDSNFA